MTEALLQQIQGWAELVIFAGIIVASVVYVRSKLSKETAENYRTALASVEVRLRAVEADKEDLSKQVKKLEARLEVVETLPLTQLATDMHKIGDILNMTADNIQSINKVLNNVTGELKKARKRAG